MKNGGLPHQFVRRIPNIAWNWSGWHDGALRTFCKADLEDYDKRWEYLRSKGMPLKFKFYGFYSMDSDYEGTEYENEMEDEWEAVVETLESISFEDMVSFYAMVDHGKKVPGDEEVHEYWVKRFDPENRIFRRKNCRKRKREE